MLTNTVVGFDIRGSVNVKLQKKTYRNKQLLKISKKCFHDRLKNIDKLNKHFKYILFYPQQPMILFTVINT